jgi:hypothetical protein
MPTEADFKRAIVRQLLNEGGFGRRIEDKFAVGSLDMLLVTPLNTIYAEAKLLKSIAALPASVAQRHQIELVNHVRNPTCCALVIGLKEGMMCFGLPGERYDAHYQTPWPLIGPRSLMYHLDCAVGAIFNKELADEKTI